MRKFSDINNSNETVELSTNKKDFIKNLLEESLTIVDGQIVGKDALAKTLNRIIELNDSKTIIKVLESIRMRSFHTLNLEWINEAIVLEKKKMEKEEECDCEDEDDCEDCEDENDEANESLNEGKDEGKYLTKKQQKLPEGLKKGMIAKMKKAGKTLDDKKDDDCEDDKKDKKDDKDDKKGDKKEDKKDDKSLSDEEKYLTPKQRKLPAGLKAGMIKRMKKSKKTVKEHYFYDDENLDTEETDEVPTSRNNHKSKMYSTFDDEDWYDEEDRQYKGDFDFDFDDEEYDDFKTFSEKHPTQKWFGPNDGESMFNQYKDKFGKIKVRTRKEELISDEFVDPIDETEEDLFVEESVSYMNDIYDLRKIMESINNNLNETHLEDKGEQLNYILSRFTDKKVEKVVLEKIAGLPDYVKTADIQKTLTNLSDTEVKDLYLKVEKIK